MDKKTIQDEIRDEIQQTDPRDMEAISLFVRAKAGRLPLPRKIFFMVYVYLLKIYDAWLSWWQR